MKEGQVTRKLLLKYRWSDLELRPYQLEGVNWLLKCYDSNHGCILSDEMGLGKTCQIIAMLTIVKGRKASEKPHLVVCPRSVLENWEKEIHRFSPSLVVLTYIGDKETRADIFHAAKSSKMGHKYNFDIFLTTYEMCLKDSLFLRTVSWNVLVVDEGHRLKNSESLLYTTLDEWDIQVRVLLTGTPLQNNLRELYALLSFVDSSKFKPTRVESFVDKFSAADQEISELHELLVPYILRRTKAKVLADLPEKNDVVLYHGLSALQKKLYKAILTKDIEAFENGSRSHQTQLMNVLMQLRKCVNHPYLFAGVEPEPFELGEHLVEASHKLTLVDRLLASLKDAGHKVLLFSQMSRMLDILQDYLGYRGYTYERLDGSVRGEERFLAVQNFNSNDETFVFLLSSKAGGQGLNLTAADTVIFMDSDFNPQNDLQAAARAHRLGQERPVKIIRLIGKKTVEEIILQRAEQKLKLTEKVIESGEFTSPSTSRLGMVADSTSHLQTILKFGMDELLAEAKPEKLMDFEKILGRSENSQWVVEKENKKDESEILESASEEPAQSMYMFEGTDYSKEPTAADIKAFEELMEAEKTVSQNQAVGDRTLRRYGTSVNALLPLPERKPRKQLTPEELEERRKKRQEAAEKRAKKAEELQILKVETQRKKREALWKDNNYTSANVVIDSEEDEESVNLSNDEEEDDESINLPGDDEEGESTSRRKRKVAIKYVMGDVTHPIDAGTVDNIMIHCADDSGSWGHGGLFSAVSARSAQPKNQYELAGRMKDLTLGDCHLIPVDDIESREEGRQWLALIIAQERDRRSNRLSGIKLEAFGSGLEKVYKVAKTKKASVHLPRIGHDTPGFNWYGTERLIQKHLASRGILTFIYYFPRKQAHKRKNVTLSKHHHKVPKDEESSSETAASTSSSSSYSNSTTPKLPTLFSGIAVYFHCVSEDTQKNLKRYIIAFDGDVEKRVSHSITHLITDRNANKLELNDLIKDIKCRVVTTDWLNDCISKGKLLPTEDYLIPLA